VASSADGRKLVAVVANGLIYTLSTDATSTVTTTGIGGFLSGNQNTAVELLYTGGGRFQTLSSQGAITAF
jgi:hypothetical protein